MRSINHLGVREGSNRRSRANGRTSPVRVAAWPTNEVSDLGLLRHLKRVVHLDSEVANGTLDHRVAKKQLHCAKIVGPPIDQSRLRSAQAVRPVGVLVESDFGGPLVHDSGLVNWHWSSKPSNAGVRSLAGVITALCASFHVFAVEGHILELAGRVAFGLIGEVR